MAAVAAVAMAILTGIAPASAAPLWFARTATIVGTPGPVVLRGTSGNDTILGLGGNGTFGGGPVTDVCLADVGDVRSSCGP